MLKFLFAAILVASSFAHAELVRKNIDYKDGSAKLQGYLVYDDAVKGSRPGVVVVHDWLGLTDENKAKADDMARLGYIAFAADVYGVGNMPKDATAAGAAAGKWKSDRKALRKRINAALATLEKQSGVDKNRLAATGYCFGGTTILELARSGAPVKSVVTFHGGLDSPAPADGRNIKAHVLVLHGADDPFNKPEDVKAFQNELRDAKVDWQMIEYGGAVHSFTIKSAGNDNSKGAAYNAEADKRSWQAMQDFLKETL